MRVSFVYNESIARDCAVNDDHIQTVSKNRIGSLISVLSPERLEEVREAIQFSLNL